MTAPRASLRIAAIVAVGVEGYGSRAVCNELLDGDGPFARLHRLQDASFQL